MSIVKEAAMFLPPPPGPEEDDEESADVRRKHAFSLSSLFSPIKPPEQPESSSETQDDTQMPGNDTTSRSKVASAPPLIDFYSQTILPRPQSNLRFPIPSAPVYDPRYSHLFPMHRSSWFGAPTSPQMFRPPRAPSVIPHSGPDDDPFDLFKSCPPKPGPNPFIHHQSVETLPDPPADPFDWDTLRRSVPSKHTTVKNELGSRSSTPVAMTQSTPPDVGRSRHVVLERQLLVGSGALLPGVKSSDIVVIAGEMNAQVGRLSAAAAQPGDRLGLDTRPTDKEDRLILMCAEHGLFLCGTRTAKIA
ncbi:hypothetical protein CSKR_114140 [Clonorchis sinensis]|uniref:Uncharacterized protein n=1 Tax=Clonorchis sinensis TaxID=79923 RepID=A0A3R7C5G2_CLOSI|nr:hypothetical protein CSKR_114140 [Clonorchis sinensis]